MKRVIFIILIIMADTYMVIAMGQNRTSAPVVLPSMNKIETLRTAINRRVKDSCEIRKDRDRADSLDVLVRDLNKLADLWESEYKSQKEIADIYCKVELLLSESDSIFEYNIEDIDGVPASLKWHFDIVLKVISIKNQIESVEQHIERIKESCNELAMNPMNEIPRLIDKEIDAIASSIKAVKETGLSTFSEEQKEYFNGLKELYNNFEMYFKSDDE